MIKYENINRKICAEMLPWIFVRRPEQHQTLETLFKLITQLKINAELNLAAFSW